MESSAEIFLKELYQRYGDVSNTGIFARDKLPPKNVSSLSVENFLNALYQRYCKVSVTGNYKLPPKDDSSPVEVSTPIENISPINSSDGQTNFLDDVTKNPFDDTLDMFPPLPEPPHVPKPVKIFPPGRTRTPPSTTSQPPPQQPPAFKTSPVNIATMKDWVLLREEVKDVHRLQNFFEGKSDTQSSLLSSKIKKYSKELENALTVPARGIDAESSRQFVEKLAEAFERRFKDILVTCQNGLTGKSPLSRDYYQQLKNLIDEYFKRIGLKVGNVEKLGNYNDVSSYMEATKIPAPHPFYRGKIADVLVQPHYFEYHDENDGEVKKFWIDGKCTVYV